jgi:CRP-like cAMP-binding protein
MVKKSNRLVAQSSVLFGSLPEPVFQAIMAHARVQRLEPGQTLFHVGYQATAAFCVLSGLVKLSINQRDGTETVIEIFHAGQSFAEALAFRSAVYPATGTALVESRVLTVSMDALRAELYANPEAFGAILGATYAHLHKLVRQIEQLKSNSGLERLVQFILALKPDEDGAVEIPFEKRVLASLLGMKPETLSRTFRRLEELGVEVSGRRFMVGDRAALRALLDSRD